MCNGEDGFFPLGTGPKFGPTGMADKALTKQLSLLHEWLNYLLVNKHVSSMWN